MRTVLDVTVCTHSTGGVGRWIRGLSKGLFAANIEHQAIDLVETHPGHICSVPDTATISPPGWMRLPLVRRLLLRKGLLESTRASRIEKITGFPDIIHLSGVQPRGNGKRKVVTFFDDTPWVSPESHTEETLFYADNLKGLIDAGAAVLTISSWAASVAQDLFGISPERTGNAGGAAEDIFTPGEPAREILERHDLAAGEYFLHVGSYVPRKNIPFLISCFKDAGTEKKLVLAGAESWGDQVYGDDPGVIFLKSITDKELLSLYRGALALLLPSSSEGLGLPVLEAFACNTPVIASDGGALRETAGGNGLILPVLEREPWITAIREMEAGIISDSLRVSAENAHRVTWKDVGEKTMDFYRSLL